MGVCLLLLAMTGSHSREDLLTTTGQLKVHVLGVAANGGDIHVAVYREATFLQDESALSSLVLSPQGKNEVTGQLEPLPFGTYAVAVYQDMNGNGQLDKNAVGIPTEPYAFSNNPAVKWRAPTFKETALQLNQAKQAISITLKYWKDY